MNCLLIEPEELEAGTGRVRLDDRRRRHAQKILGVQPGDRLRVGIVNGRLGQGEVTRLDDAVLELDVVFDEAPPAKLSIDLVLARPRPPVFRRLLSTIASLGVGRLLVVGTARTEKSFWQSHVLEPQAIPERLQLGL